MTWQAIASIVGLAVAIVGFYVTFRNQQRLKAFELFSARREAVLKAVEEKMKCLDEVMHALPYRMAASGFEAEKNLVARFERTEWRDSFALNQKLMSASFGYVVNDLAQAFDSINNQIGPLQRTKVDLKDHIERKQNLLGVI